MFSAGEVSLSNELVEVEGRVRGAYERTASQYDVQTQKFNTEVSYPHMIRLLSDLLGALKSRLVLDVGCGSGRLIEALRTEGADAQGIDLTHAFVASARSRGLQVIEGSMLSLPWDQEVFDATVSYFSLNYLPYLEQTTALREQYRVLKQGGVLVCASKYPQAETTVVRVPLLGECYELFVKSMTDTTQMLEACGFANAELVAAPCPPCDFDVFNSGLDPAVAAYMSKFSATPYALFITARKL